MQAQSTADYKTGQLSLNLSGGFFVPNADRRAAQLKRIIVFPKHIMIPHFGAFQRQVNALFAPFGISVEFGLSRQKRLQMTWVFPPDPVPASHASQPNKIGNSSVAASASISGGASIMPSPVQGILSDEEVSAFTDVVFAFAGQS
ncbi:MAG: hypothetical protein ACON5P_04005 [Candidatus Puniceispirillaceae bacterium]